MFWRFQRGEGKRIEDLRVAERGGMVFPKTKAKRDLLRPRTVCRKDEEAYPVSSITDLYTAIEFFYFIFYGRLDGYFPLLPFHEVRIEGRKWRNMQKYIDSDTIGRLGILKNALLLLIPIF